MIQRKGDFLLMNLQLFKSLIINSHCGNLDDGVHRDGFPIKLMGPPFGAAGFKVEKYECAHDWESGAGEYNKLLVRCEVAWLSAVCIANFVSEVVPDPSMRRW